MVPEVCGNVSVLGQSDTALRNHVLSARGAGSDDPAAMRWMPAVLKGNGQGTAATGYRGRNAQEVPEPGTLACVLAALGGLRWARGRG